VSVIGRKLSIIRPGATTVVAPKSVGSMSDNDHERANESNVQGEYKGVPVRKEQPNQTYDRIQHSNRSDLQRKQRKKSSIVGPTIEPAKQPT
jgi:hypothetical protein